MFDIKLDFIWVSTPAGEQSGSGLGLWGCVTVHFVEGLYRKFRCGQADCKHINGKWKWGFVWAGRC